MKLAHVVPCLIVLCIIMLLLEDTSGIDNVNLGAIFTLGTFNGKISKIAMETAVDDINSDPSILSDRNLTLEIHDSDYNGFLSVMGGKFLPMLLSCLFRYWIIISFVHLGLFYRSKTIMEDTTHEIPRIKSKTTRTFNVVFEKLDIFWHVLYIFYQRIIVDNSNLHNSIV